jgi:hypothetical protein
MLDSSLSPIVEAMKEFKLVKKYYNKLLFFPICKKKIRTGPFIGGPTPEGQRWNIFDFSEFETPRTISYEPYRIVNRADP